MALVPRQALQALKTPMVGARLVKITVEGLTMEAIMGITQVIVDMAILALKEAEIQDRQQHKSETKRLPKTQPVITLIMQALHSNIFSKCKLIMSRTTAGMMRAQPRWTTTPTTLTIMDIMVKATEQVWNNITLSSMLLTMRLRGEQKAIKLRPRISSSNSNTTTTISSNSNTTQVTTMERAGWRMVVEQERPM